ncbi:MULTISPECIES: LysR family transcriptional regulator [Roseobacteraceae]
MSISFVLNTICVDAYIHALLYEIDEVFIIYMIFCMDRPFDWNRMRAFLATANEGTLTAAAHSLGLTQPTLSRQISALEEELGLMLFERVGRGLVLTAAGREMQHHVREMGAAADRVALAALGQAQSIEGDVRITASDILSAVLLPPAVSRIKALAPNLVIDVIAANDVRDLMRREADIAVRHVRPEHPDLVVRLICEAKAYFYASKEYLAARGHPQSLSDLDQHDFISMGNVSRMVEYLRNIGIHLEVQQFQVGSENGVVGWALAQAGLGIIPMDEAVARHSPNMVQVLPHTLISFPIWLTTHREIHTSPKMRLVFDVLAEVLAQR